MSASSPCRGGAAGRARGSSLVEVLVGLVVLSLGVLAMAGIAVAAQRMAKMSQYESLAMQAATEIAERMRANVPGFEAGAYELAGGAASAADPRGCVALRCTPGEIAAVDLAEWSGSLAQRLPEGRAVVRRDVAHALVAEVWVRWRDPDLRLGAGSTLSVPRAAGACPATPSGSAGEPDAAAGSRCARFRISL
ncbi:MAG: type IV pilus modification protein PilV [Comamonadaceae bacterium]|nr:MAG: type IV pilus modification protein PilV [Comamonadaceae bacterium]